MSKPVKLAIAAAAALLLIGAGTFAWQANNDTDQSQNSSETKTGDTKSTTEHTEHEHEHVAEAEAVTYQGVEGKNALELLKASHKVETKTYEGIGEMVTSIDGVAPDSKHFWALYVNDQQSQVGASAYITKSTDTLTWKLEAIQ